MLNSAGGGEAPDRRAEGVMSRPAGETLPQRPRPAPPPQVVPPPRALAWGASPPGPRTRPARSPATPASLTEWTDPREPPGPQLLGEGRSARWALVAPRPAPGLPLPPCAPLPCTPFPASLPGRRGAGPGRGRRRAGTARSPAALWAARPSGRSSSPARPALPPAFVVPASSVAAACGPRAACRDLGSALRGPELRGPHRIRERRGGRPGAPQPRHGAPGRRLVAAVCGRRVGLLRPRGPCQQEPELQRSPPDLRRQGLQPERCAPGGDLG